MSFGNALKQARESQGLTTQDLALRTKIRGDYLRALEDNNTALLPERTFARSYLQRYARELSLDPAPLLAEFDRSMPPSAEVSQSLRGAASRDTAARGMSPGLLAGLLTGLIVLGGAGYYAYQTYLKPAPRVAVTPATTPPPPPPSTTTASASAPAQPAPGATVRLTVSSVPPGARVFLDNRDLGITPVQSFPVDSRARAELRVEYAGRTPLKQTIDLSQGRNLRARLLPSGQVSSLTDLNNRPKPAAKPAAAATTPAATTTAASAAAPAATPVKPVNAVSVSFTGEAWTRITDATGRVLYQGTPPAGTQKGFPAGVIIRTGNAGAVKVSVSGAPAQAMGQAGQVLTRKY